MIVVITALHFYFIVKPLFTEVINAMGKTDYQTYFANLPRVELEIKAKYILFTEPLQATITTTTTTKITYVHIYFTNLKSELIIFNVVQLIGFPPSNLFVK